MAPKNLKKANDPRHHYVGYQEDTRRNTSHTHAYYNDSIVSNKQAKKGSQECRCE